MCRQTFPLLRLLPAIKRSRGGYLYDHKGRRFLDLWLDEGTLYHGHQVHSILQVLKNSLSQTAFNPYPNLWHTKATTALLRTFAAKEIIFTSSTLPQTFSQPWQKSASGHYWLRLSQPLPADTQMAKLAINLAGYHCYLIFADNIVQSVASSILPAALARMLLIELSLAKADTGLTTLHLTPHWHWHGSYFSSTQAADVYEKIFIQALEHDILLPPHHQGVGLWQEDLFSEGQNALIRKFLQGDSSKL